MEKNRNLIKTFNYAIDGIIYTLKSQKNMKVHYGIAILVLFLSLFLNLSRIEIIAVFFSITLVILSEMFNTAIEKTIDLVSPDYHPLAKIVKDIAAGAVFIAAMNSLVVGYMLFFERLSTMGDILLLKITNSPMHMTIIAIMLVLIFTIGLKIAFKHLSHGTHLHGGAFSGHSALAFCSATIISTIAANTIVTFLAYIMALLVAESRVEGRIHTVAEVIAGGVMGLLVGVLIFQVIGGQ